MDEETQTIAVRKLEAILVLLGDDEVCISLRRKENECIETFLNDRQDTFVRKVHAKTTQRFFYVPGIAGLDADTAEATFVDVLYVAYQKEEVWKLATARKKGLVGVMRMESPNSRVPTHIAPKAGSKNGKKTYRDPTKVQLANIMALASTASGVTVVVMCPFEFA